MPPPEEETPGDAPESAAEELLRDRIRFEFVRLIAEGGMGEVYEALQHGAEGFQKRVAIKLIRGEAQSNPRHRDRFVSEAKLVADLVHQNIVQIYQLGSVEDLFYIVMEYINGCDLLTFWKEHQERDRQVPVDLACFIASRICRGLDYAHRSTDAKGEPLGVVHRDISLSNIMITTEGVVKLADFGIAKVQVMGDDYEKKGVVVGKPGYLSPEQTRGEVVDARSDLFALGIVTHELITRRRLFSGKSFDEVRDAVLNQDIPPLGEFRDDVPDEVERILRRALARDLGERYPDAGTMGTDLEKFLYSDGFGPTNVTLEAYLREVFPTITRPALGIPLESATVTLIS